jgi:hypothetical protein
MADPLGLVLHPSSLVLCAVAAFVASPVHEAMIPHCCPVQSGRL